MNSTNIQVSLINISNGVLMAMHLDLHPTHITLIFTTSNLDHTRIIMSILLSNLLQLMWIIVKWRLWKQGLKSWSQTKLKFWRSWKGNTKCFGILNWKWVFFQLIDLQLKVLKVSMSQFRRVSLMLVHHLLAAQIEPAKNLTTKNCKWQLYRENKWSWCWIIVWRK